MTMMLEREEFFSSRTAETYPLGSRNRRLIQTRQFLLLEVTVGAQFTS